MSDLQILVTTMNQNDFTKYKDMNLQTDAVIANQSNTESKKYKNINTKDVLLITTTTQGLSKNRNIAISNCSDSAKYLMFSDDDLVFHNGYESIVCKAFSDHPEADAIKFNLNCISDRKLSMKPIKAFHRARRYEVTCFGVCALAIKKEILKKYNLSFNERFGAGTNNFCGEDTIFFQELFKKRIRLYCSPEYIADIAQSKSSWFKGYNEHYFSVAGMVISEIYPYFCYLLVIRSAFRFSRRINCNLGFLTILRSYYRGIKKNNEFHRNQKIA
ncbi:hypothetical protein SDC9_127710 [bioreactor metagenome]|uniref:Glycosyltransferase 2-like domain-containing protein n=1 Tax=bioreactor metagenome TaxID=1076179 RepID=A0A645CU61_9ZZZZ